jgi:single-strand DNA-binding protein
MNKVILMGRLTRDPDVRYSNSQTGEQMAIARYTVAVDRRFARRAGAGDNQQNADFISCVAFGRQGEFAEKYLKQGTKIALTGRIQTGSYTNKEGQRVYTTEVVVEEQEFAESKGAGGQSQGGYEPQSAPAPEAASAEGFMNIPEGIENDLPFK